MKVEILISYDNNLLIIMILIRENETYLELFTIKVLFISLFSWYLKGIKNRSLTMAGKKRWLFTARL